MNYQKGDARKWENAQLWMRLAQAISVPHLTTDNPIEYGEVLAELDRSARRDRWTLALGVVAASGLVGFVSALVTHALGAT